MTTTGNPSSVREVVGIFIGADRLKGTVDELLALGLRRGELGILATEQVVERSLGDLWLKTDGRGDNPNTPEVAFIGQESEAEVTTPLGGSLYFVGTTGAMGAVVASAAVLGGGLLAALSGVAAVGAVGAMVGSVIHQDDADYLAQQVEEGHLLLFARVPDPAMEKPVKEIMSRHGSIDARVYDIPGE